MLHDFGDKDKLWFPLISVHKGENRLRRLLSSATIWIKIKTKIIFDEGKDLDVEETGANAMSVSTELAASIIPALGCYFSAGVAGH